MDQKSIFEAIAEGFRKTPGELTWAILIIMGIICLMSLFPLFYRFLIRIKLRKKWLDDYNKYLRKLDLTINEIDLLEELSSFLIDPYNKTLLLKNRNTFQKALSLWKRKGGAKSKYGDSLIKKLFTEQQQKLPEDFENVHKSGRPARFVSPEGIVYSGRLNKGRGDIMILGNVRKLENKEISGLGRLIVQDYRGISSHSVTDYKKSDIDSLTLTLAPERKSTKKLSLSEIYVIPFEGGPSIKNNLRLLSKREGVIENRDLQFKIGQTVKVAFRRESKEIYRVNAMVTSLSLNKRYVKLRFGYLNPKK